MRLPLVPALVLALLACGRSSRNPPPPPEPSVAGGDAAASEPLPPGELAELHDVAGSIDAHDVIVHTPLFRRAQRLLTGSYPRFLGAVDTRLLGSGAFVYAPPRLERACETGAFWVDLRHDHLAVALVVGGAVRRFDEAKGGTPPPPALQDQLTALDAAVAHGCRERYPERTVEERDRTGCGSLIALDPGRVYLLGTLEPGRSGKAALAAPGQPDRYMVGFPGSPVAVVLRPTDSGLVYDHADADRLALFVPDLAPDAAPVGVDRLWGGAGCAYPREPEANDEAIQTPGCEARAGPGRFWVRADDGRVVYRCAQGDEGEYYLEGGQRLDASSWAGRPLSFGHHGSVLLARPGGLAVVDTASGAAHTVDLPPSLRPEGPVRALRDGYWIAPLDAGADRITGLWHVSEGGALSPVARYGDPPAEARFVSGSWQHARLDAGGDLWLTTYGSGPDEIVVLQRDGGSHVAYREQVFPEPLVKMFGGVLVTGP